MIKGKKTNLTMVLSVMALLVCLLFAIVNVTGAWFTDASGSNKTINAIIKTAETNLNVYQEDSSGTQTLLSKSLPTGYTQLEYIESTGTQYIDTGYVYKTAPKVETEIYITTANDRDILGTSKANSSCFIVDYYIGGKTVYARYGQSSASTYTTSVNQDTWTNVSYGSTWIEDGDVKYTETSYDFSANTSSILLFGARNYSSLRMKVCKIYDGETIVRNFVPAKNSSGTIGMYDTVGNKFYTNAGTGTFTAGSATLSGASISLAYDSSNTTNNKVMFGTAKTLKLLLKNEDLGKSFGIRYKVEFFVATPAGKKALSATIAGMTAPTSSTNGFKLNSDGWYYYQNNSGANVVFEPATSSAVTSRYLMTSFTIKADSTTTALLGGNAIYMQISVESVAIS